MAGILDTASGLWNQGVNATLQQITDMQTKAAALKRLAADMLAKRARLQAAIPSLSAKDPAVAAAVRGHLNRGYDLQSMVQSALKKVDDILAALRTGTAASALSGLGLAPLAAAVPYVALGAVLSAIGAAYYAVSGYNKRTDYLLVQVDALQKAGATPEQMSKVFTAANASADTPGKAISTALQGTRGKWLLIGGALAVGYYVWRHHK